MVMWKDSNTSTFQHYYFLGKPKRQALHTCLPFLYILECNTDKDHIHLLVNCSSQHYIPDMIKALKGVSARLLMKEFGEELKRKLWGGHLWNPSYFVATVSENTEEQIRKYIQNQKRK